MLGNFLDDANAQLRQLQREASQQAGEAQEAIMQQINDLQHAINREIERVRQKESLKQQMEARVSSEVSELKSRLSSSNPYKAYASFLLVLQGKLVGELDGKSVEALDERVFQHIKTCEKAEGEFEDLLGGISIANWVVRNVKGLY